MLSHANAGILSSEAFMFCTALDLIDASFQLIRQLVLRQRFFNDLRALTCFLYFDSWETRMVLIIKGPEVDAPDTNL